MYVTSVPYRCCKKSRSGCCICCNGYTLMLQVSILKMFHLLRHILQVFYLNVTYVVVAIHTVAIHIYCKAYVPDVSSASYVCCRKCFHVASVSWVGACSPRRRGQSLCARYGCCKSRSGCHICCNGYIRMLQVSIHNVLFTLDICWKCFYLDFAYITVVVHIRCKSMF
jgi:hypothetical protein